MTEPERRCPANAPPPGSLPIVLAVAVWLALWVIQARFAAPPAPRPADAPAAVFSAGRAGAVLLRLGAGGGPHPTGSPAARELADRILAELSALGLAPEVQEVFACGPYRTCGDVRNLFARIEGERAGPGVLLVAHYDSVPAGPGVADDLAGVATLIEVARALLAAGPTPNTVFLLVTDGEEAGLLGAQGFVDDHPAFAAVGAVVNVEARGASGPSVLFETSDDNAWLIELYGQSAARPSASSLWFEVYRRMPNDTDLSVFKAAGLPGVNFAFADDVQRYHTPRDSLAGLSHASLQHQGENMLAMARALASAPLANPPTGDAVYGDVFGRTLLVLPATACVPLAAAILLALLAVAWRARRAGRIDVRRALWSVAALAATALAPLLACAALWALIVAVSGSSSAWFANAVPMEIAFGAAALLAAILAARAFARCTDAFTAALAAWLAWAALGLVLAWFLPGAAYLFFVPMIGPALASILRGRAREECATVAPAVLAFALAAFVWAPVRYGLSIAFGLYGGLAIALPTAVLGTLLAPLALGAKSVRGLGRLLAIAAITGSAVALAVPRRTLDRPAPLDLVYELDAGAGEAVWEVRAFGTGLPPSLRGVADFVEKSPGVFIAPAPTLDFEPAVLELEASEVIADASGRGPGRRVRCRVRSPGRADRTLLELPEGRLVGAVVGGRRLRGRGGSIVLLNVPVEGLALELVLLSPSPVAIRLSEIHFGLPPAGAELEAARPPEYVPRGAGDRTVIRSEVKL
ncbi:MAG: M20/M25/M40 family metallo-hydrolase [Planctomycetota bacterium]|nr:MAG: M20/M25/M40 family metallo-hydrolase [Planctomycetota bacterium]